MVTKVEFMMIVLMVITLIYVICKIGQRCIWIL